MFDIYILSYFCATVGGSAVLLLQHFYTTVLSLTFGPGIVHSSYIVVTPNVVLYRHILFFLVIGALRCFTLSLHQKYSTIGPPWCT